MDPFADGRRAGVYRGCCVVSEHPRAVVGPPPRDWKSIPTLEVEPRPIGGFGSEILSLRSLLSSSYFVRPAVTLTLYYVPSLFYPLSFCSIAIS